MHVVVAAEDYSRSHTLDDVKQIKESEKRSKPRMILCHLQEVTGIEGRNRKRNDKDENQISTPVK